MTDFLPARERLVAELRARGVRDERVLAAFASVPREDFVDPSRRGDAYLDRPLPITQGQTISQPYVVAYMLERLRLAGTESVLEVGTGSGYETALLSRLAGRVATIEIEPELAESGRKAVEAFGARNVRFFVGDGLSGLPQEAPFDRVVLAAAVERPPAALLEQLALGGCFLGPVGGPRNQKLVKITRTGRGLESVDLGPVLFLMSRRAS